MKIGMIGVGKWGRTLAHAFNRAGVEVAAHSRLTDGALPDRFGPRVEWKDILSDTNIDAVVAATPPDVTLEIFRACQEAGKPCLLTKPLLLPPETKNKITAAVYVDYVHLFSPLWGLVTRITHGNTIKSMSATSTGQGPVRSFPQSLDYGPHALALLLDAYWDLNETIQLESSLIQKQPDGGETLWAEINMNGPRATMCAGQDLRLTSFRAELMNDELLEVAYSESNGRATMSINGQEILRDDAHDPLARLIQEFIVDVRTGETDPMHVMMSKEIASILKAAREHALPKLPSTE